MEGVSIRNSALPGPEKREAFCYHALPACLVAHHPHAVTQLFFFNYGAAPLSPALASAATKFFNFFLLALALHDFDDSFYLAHPPKNGTLLNKPLILLSCTVCIVTAPQPLHLLASWGAHFSFL